MFVVPWKNPCSCLASKSSIHFWRNVLTTLKKNGSIHHPVSSICIDRLKDLFADQNSGPEIGPAWHATVGIIRLQGLQLAKVGTLAGHGADFNWAVGRTTWAC